MHAHSMGQTAVGASQLQTTELRDRFFVVDRLTFVIKRVLAFAKNNTYLGK